MNTKKIFILLIIFNFFSQVIISQNQLKGKIIDKKTQEPLPFANIYLPEINKNTVTDKKGHYLVKNLPNGKTKVQVSYIGYKTTIKTIFINKKETELNFELEMSILQAEEVVVSGGTPSSQHENAIKIELIKAEEINSTGNLSLTDAITKIPGVDMIAKGNGVSKPVIRGLSMTNILMLNNGVKLENFQFSENHPFIIDEFGINRVEIIKGPATLLYGSDAVGGVINVLKEKPAPIGKIIGDFNSQFHSNTYGFVSNIGLKGSSNKFIWGIRTGLKTHKDYLDGNLNVVPNSRFNEKILKINTGFNKNFGTFRFYYDYNKPKLGMTIKNIENIVQKNKRKNEFWYQDLTNHVFSTRNTLYFNKFKLKINAAYQMNNRKLQTSTDMPSFEMVNMDLNTLSYEIKTHLPSNLNSEYIIGFQGANKTNKNNQAPNHVLPDAKINDYSGFALFQYTFFDKLKTQAGLRFDFRNIKTKAEDNKPAIDTFYNNISGSIGVTYKIISQILVRANIASAYRSPNIAELTQNGMHGARYEQGNPDLNTQRNYELDLSTHFHSDYIMIDVSGFYNKILDYIFIAPTNDTANNGNKIYRYSQTNATIYGGEICFDIHPFKWFSLKTGYGYLKGKKDDGSYLPFIPHNKIKIETKFKKNKISIFEDAFFKIGGIFAQKQNNPAMFETETNSYFLLNAAIGAQIKAANQKISFSVQANNILNETYFDHLSTLKPLGYYNIGRNICFNLKVPFRIK